MKRQKNFRKTIKKFNNPKAGRTLITGTVQCNESGYAFIIPDDKEKYKKDFFVSEKNINNAMNGDRVLAEYIRGTRDEARIIKVTERVIKFVTGTFKRFERTGIVYPDDFRLPEIIVPLSQSLDTQSGYKVVCEISSSKLKGTPTGKVTEILGQRGLFSVEELSIIRSFGLYGEFPDKVQEEAATVAKETIVTGSRRDLRGKLIFTIDGIDTRDIDDAVSLEVEDGKFILGVHIADVSHYVKYRSALDKEAYSRGTSVYFPDTVLPMLPEELSNGACSLNEGGDRYAVSCLMTFGADGERVGYEIFESVISSRHKTTYPEITAICDGDKEITKKYSDIAQTVKNMQKLCLILEKKRKAAGEINLGISESKIYIDNDENIVITCNEQTISERIIEQFMIAANEAVAEFLLKKGAPCLYRIHEKPSTEKAEGLAVFLKELGIDASYSAENVCPQDFQRILDKAADKPYATTVNKVMLRSMQKARYCEKNSGHFGLASECYCHFTSPIRRYPDLFVHRSLKEILHGGDPTHYASKAQAAGIDCSERERIADEAERSVDNLYKAVYMYDRIGEVYDAVISGIANAGVFCELDNGIEGLIPLLSLPDPYYEYCAEKHLLKGPKNSYRLGDRIKIRVDGCDLRRMRITFSLEE